MIFLSQKFARFVIFLYLCIVKQKQNVIYKLQSKKGDIIMKTLVAVSNKGVNAMVVSNQVAHHAQVIARRTGSEEMGLMKSLLIETLKAKLQTTAHFWYRKVSTNEIREAWGTTNHALMANKIIGTGYSGEPVNTVKYWDIERGGFRSLRLENLVAVA